MSNTAVLCVDDNELCTELGSGRQEVHTKYIAGKNFGNENWSIAIREGNVV